VQAGAIEAAASPAGPPQWLQWLPPGWVVLGRCRYGTAGPGPLATGCQAIAHPAIGIALIDIAPDATPNAEARLRRALGTAEFWPDFPGTLPVWHGRIEEADCRDLEALLHGQFAVLPPLTVAGGLSWVRAVRQAMAADPAWEVPGQAALPTPMPTPVAEAKPRPNRRRSLAARGRRAALVLGGVLLTFAVGVATGFALLPDPVPVDRPMPARQAARAGTETPAMPRPATDQAAPTARLRAAAITMPHISPADPAAGGVAGLAAPGAVPQGGASAERDAAVPPAAASLAARPPEVEPAGAPAVAVPAEDRTWSVVASRPGQPGPALAALPGPGQAAGPPAAGPFESQELPDPPPAAPVPPARAVVQAAAGRPVRAPQAAGIDRACSRAVFRYQQGEVLTTAEVAHVRNGCATRR